MKKTSNDTGHPLSNHGIPLNDTIIETYFLLDRSSQRVPPSTGNYPAYILCDDPLYERTLTRPIIETRMTAGGGGETMMASSIKRGGLAIEPFDKFLSTLDPQLTPIRREPNVTKLNNLLTLIEGHHDRRRLRQLLADAQPRQSKWFDPNKPGQAELYDALERVLLQLKAFTPHSAPFLQRVNRKDVPDYYDVIKKPMDLGTIHKKLKSFAYTNRNQFIADLDLMYDNCYIYNSDPESPFRRHVDMLKERWQQLMTVLPDVTVGGSGKDDIDSLLNDHLDRLSEDDTTSSLGSQTPNMNILFQTSTGSLPPPSAKDHHPRSTDLTLAISKRSSLGMGAYHRCGTMGNPETAFFHQSFPDDSLSIPALNGSNADSMVVKHPMDRSIVEQCELLCRIRAMLNPPTLAKGANKGGKSGPPTLPLPHFVKSYASGDLYTSRLGAHVLRPVLGWLILQAGFQCFHSGALSTLADITGHLLAEILHSLKLYIEMGATDGSLIASRLIQEHCRRGTTGLLRFIRDAPPRTTDRLTVILRSLNQRQEAPEHHPSDPTVPEDDVDLELLGDPTGWTIPSKRPPPPPDTQSEIENGDDLSLQDLLRDSFVPSEG